MGITLLFAACSAPPVPEAMRSATSTPMPSITPTSTATPTPTFTPTPTAVPISISDNLRAIRVAAPSSQRGAPCGVVDLLDFPLGPPDGDHSSARWSFGRYSERYSGIHAGEDWVLLGGDSLGQPVHAIGHGRVTYAQPYGWGIDQGVVIVRHVFSDGHTILSFYGHLDPPSVVLKPGDCVKRGDQVGAVGKPRGRPHLHFEIRHYMPDQPGPGYWSVDPRLAGWEPPTEYIWDERMSTSPGVQWLRTFTSTNSIGLGVIRNSFVAFDDDRLFALNADDGQAQWTRPLTATFYRAILNPVDASIYLSTITGTLESFSITGTLKWQIDFARTDRPALMPMPGGGVIVQNDQQLIGLSSTADRLWQLDRGAAPFDWLLLNDRVLFTTSGDQAAIEVIDRAGQLTPLANIGGQLLLAHDQVFFYNATGVYRLNTVTHSADLLLPLDSGSVGAGSIVAASDGTLIISRRSFADRRLIALNPNGTLRWDRSVADLGRNAPSLVTIGQNTYAITLDGDVLLIDIQTGAAQRIFDGGSNLSVAGEPWGIPAGSGLLIFDFRGGTLVAFDPMAAIDRIDAAADP